MNRYVLIAIGERPRKLPDLDHWDWQTWRNCEGDSERFTAQLALNKRIREMGGIETDSPEPLRLYVYVADADTPRYPNGRLKRVTEIVFVGHPRPIAA